MNKEILQDYLNKLNNEQRQAATLGDVSAVILAAAGSGKTSTLTARIAHLIVGQSIAPQNILAVTFTNKAAKEMNQRLYKMGLDVKSLWVGTFHGICNKILRFHAPLVGMKKNFYIMDSQEQESFFKRMLRANGYDPKNLNVSDLISKINGYKEVGWRSSQLKVNTQERTIYELYEKACFNDNCVDFGELLLACYELFKNNADIAEMYSDKFKHILVDEFQDTNELQYKWLKILASKHQNIFAVGDDDQCFVAGTEVTLGNGVKKPIENIRKGDLVLSLNNKSCVSGKVMNVYEKQVQKEFAKISLESGQSVESTAEHLYFVLRQQMEQPKDFDYICELYANEKDHFHKVIEVKTGAVCWDNDLGSIDDQKRILLKAHINNTILSLVRAKDIKVNDMLYVADFGFAKVSHVSTYQSQAVVYDLDVQYYHNFFANGILVHNSIYSFRGAKPENINLLKRDFNAQLIKIEKNYRSDGYILKAANAVIANNTNRQGKNLVATHGSNHKIMTFQAFNDEEESAFVAQEIKKIRRANIPYQNVAILYRTNGQSRSLEKAMNSQNIPYIIYGGFRFFDRQEVKHAMAYLRLAHNPNDNMAFLRVANIPVRSIGDTTLKKLEVYANEESLSMYEASRSWPDKNQKKLTPFIELIDHLHKVCKGKKLPDMVRTVIIDSGLEKMYEDDKKEGPERLDNLYELISAAEVYVSENQNADIEEFLAFSALESDVNSNKRDESVDSVKLMTVHASKGLEFEVVFITGMEETLFPHANSLGEPEMIEEERRLMYVAITRAKKHLYITNSEERLIHGQRNRLVKSRFFKELPPDVLSKIR